MTTTGRGKDVRWYEASPNGHVWKKDDDGHVDIFAHEVGNHNGPECVNCGYTFCHHCKYGEPVPVCTKQPRTEIRAGRGGRKGRK